MTCLDPVLAGRIVDFLRGGVERLNAVSERDPFWDRTNREPTFYKLADYFGPWIESHPEDEQAHWILIADGLNHCHDNLAGSVLRLLVKRDFSNVLWAVAAGRWIWRRSGFSARSSLRELLEGLRGEPESKVLELGQLADPYLRSMAKLALDIHRGGWYRAAPGTPDCDS